MKIQTPKIEAMDARRQTERIVNSSVFANARRSQRLLRYLIEVAIANPTQTVKEYTLAADVFDRDPSYDPSVDATVRVEAGRLRWRLREYYGVEGREDELLIDLPKGAYRAVLTLRGESQGQNAERHDAKSVPESQLTFENSPEPRIAAAPAVKPQDVRAAAALPVVSFTNSRRSSPFRHWITARARLRYVFAAVALVLLLGYAGWRLVREQRPHPYIRTVAVLPLKNLSGDPAQDYFADGATDELITELARVPELRVVSWNSVIQEKDTKKSLKEIAGELRADLLVEGSVSGTGQGKAVRINAQLIDTRNDNHLWADSYEGPTSEMMSLESKAAVEIAAHARLDGRGLMSSGADHTSRPLIAIDPAAHDAYLRGKNYFDKRQAEASVEQFQHAIDLSPTYAQAYAGFSEALQSEAFLGDVRLEQVIPKAVIAVNKALELDPNNGDALIARGSIETAFLWQWDAAERDLTSGIALSPNNSYGHMMLSVYLDSVGRTDDAVKQMREAVEIDPLSFFMARHYGSALFYARRYDEALHQLLYAREMNPVSAATVDHWISDAYAKEGKYDEAVRYDILGQQDIQSNLDWNKLLAAYHRGGWQSYWAVRLEAFQEKSTDPLYNYDAATAAMRAGHRRAAIAALKLAANEHCYWLGVARVDPVLDDIRDEPGFSEILASLNLPPGERR